MTSSQSTMSLLYFRSLMRKSSGERGRTAALFQRVPMATFTLSRLSMNIECSRSVQSTLTSLAWLTLEFGQVQGVPNIRRFARKALRDNDDPRLFNAERQNLTYVKRVQDRHLVQIIKAYKHGDVGNVILPLAKTNLGAYLRDPSYKASEQSQQGIELHPFWEQILGVSRALHKILVQEAPDSTRNEVLYSSHFDLKPANVLIEDSGVFVISEFGQAYFRKLSEATSSKVIGMGGTESYAPAEIDDPAMLRNRRYDIWSLGCILLEICTFVVRGYPGVLELDVARITTTEAGNMTDD